MVFLLKQIRCTLTKHCGQISSPPPSTLYTYALCQGCYQLTHYLYCYILELVIGFLSDRYRVSESDGTALIEFGVITGSLGTTIFVQLSLSDGSAMCKLLSTQCC